MNEQTQETTAEKPSTLKLALAWALSLLCIFIFFYVISYAWAKGRSAVK